MAAIVLGITCFAVGSWNEIGLSAAEPIRSGRSVEGSSSLPSGLGPDHACTQEDAEHEADYTRVYSRQGIQPPEGPSIPYDAESYAALLRKLGAVPLRELVDQDDDIHFRTEPQPDGKDPREDIYGWLMPTTALNYWKQGRGPKPSLEISDVALSYILDVDSYTRTKDPLLWTMNHAVIERIANLPFSSVDGVTRKKLLEAYRARAGFDSTILSVLKPTAAEVIDLYASNPNPLAIEYLPPPVPSDQVYLNFLFARATEYRVGNYRRLLAYQLLATAQPNYESIMIAFASGCASEILDHGDRRRVLNLLVKSKHPEAMGAVDRALRHDPWVEVRSDLLWEIRRQRRESDFADALLYVASGRGSRCGMVGCCEPGTRLSDVVSEVLDGALARKNLAPVARAMLSRAREELPAHGSLNCPLWGRGLVVE